MAVDNGRYQSNGLRILGGLLHRQQSLVNISGNSKPGGRRDDTPVGETVGPNIVNVIYFYHHIYTFKTKLVSLNHILQQSRYFQVY